MPEARAALEEAVRRVGSIAIVHETLSHAPEELVDFDDIADRVIAMAGEVSAPETRGDAAGRIGGVRGAAASVIATPLAMVLTELLQNALQHGLGPLGPRACRTDHRGAGRAGARAADGDRARQTARACPPGFDLENPTSLGLQIVRTLVVGELWRAARASPRGPVEVPWRSSTCPSAADRSPR